MSASDPRLPQECRLVRFDAIGSTNDEARRLASAGAEEGTLVWALQQTGGRGRRGRGWVSPPGNLYASMILRPDCEPARAAQMGFVVALAIEQALAPLLPDAASLRLKWPNDVLVNASKIAGILLESEMAADDAASGRRRLDFLIVGFGINLVSAPAGTETAATSLLGEGGPPVAPEIILEILMPKLLAWRRQWQQQGFAPIRAAWRERAAGLGEAIRVRLERTTFEGIFADLDEEGALWLDAAGERRRIAAGEVFSAGA